VGQDVLSGDLFSTAHCNHAFRSPPQIYCVLLDKGLKGLVCWVIKLLIILLIEQSTCRLNQGREPDRDRISRPSYPLQHMHTTECCYPFTCTAERQAVQWRSHGVGHQNGQWGYLKMLSYINYSTCMMLHLLLRAVQRDTTGRRQLVTAALGQSRHARRFWEGCSRPVPFIHSYGYYMDVLAVDLRTDVAFGNISKQNRIIERYSRSKKNFGKPILRITHRSPGQNTRSCYLFSNHMLQE